MSVDTRPNTIVLIHGLWLNALSWEHWVERYSSAGYKVLAESWPGMDRNIASLREDHAAFDRWGSTR